MTCYIAADEKQDGGLYDGQRDLIQQLMGGTNSVQENSTILKAVGVF